MESICYRHQQVLKWQRKWNGQDSFVPCSNIFGHEVTQVYGTILPKELTNQAMLESKAYQKYYAFASGKKAPKPKYIQKEVDSDNLPRRSPVQATKVAQVMELTPSQVPDKQQQKVTSTNEGAGVTPEVLDVPKYDSESEEEYWIFSQDDEDAEEESDMNDDSDETESDNDGDDLTHPNFVNFSPDYELTEEEEYKEDVDKDKEGEHEEEEEDDLYRDLNINLERYDAEMTDAQPNQDMEDTYVTLTTVLPVVQQQSSSISSDLVSKFINPYLDTGIDSILNQDTQSDTLVNVPISVAAETPSVSALESKMSEFRQTSQFAEAVSLILGIFDTYLASKRKEAVDVIDSTMKAIIKEHVQTQVSKSMPNRLRKFELKKILIDKMETNKSIDRLDTQKNLYNALVESYNTDKDIITSYDDVVILKRGRDDQDKDEDPSADQTEGRKEGNQAKKLSKSTHAEDHDQKAADLEDQPHQEFNT
ncbi:hypothetical protein Tco_1345197 [Tanacetum coccineum]